MSLFGRDYDSVQVGGDYRALPGGGYVCVIKKAQMTTNSNGLPMIKVAIDIAEGDYAGYWQEQFRSKMASDPNAEYPYNGVLRITATDENGNTKKNFKSFCTSVEKSNGIEALPRHDEAFLKALVGKMVGVLYQREQYRGNDGKERWSTKPKWFRDVETIRSGRFTKPEDVYLDDSYEDTGFSSYEPQTSADSFNASIDEIPF